MQKTAVFVMNGLDNVYDDGAIADPIEKPSNVSPLTSNQHMFPDIINLRTQPPNFPL